MSMQLSFAAVALAAVASLGAAIPAAAQSVTLRLATTAPEKTVWATQLGRFAADVAEASKGDVKIDVFYNSQLGNEQDAAAQLIRGRIDLMMISNIGISSQEPAAIVSQWYFLMTPQERDCVLDKHLVEPYRALLAPRNFHFLGWMEAGRAGVAAKRKMTSPSDYRNIKLGYSPNKFATEFWKAYGAVPVATPAPEAASSLGTGLIDVYPIQPVFYVAAGINKVAPVYSSVPLGISPALLVANKGVFEKLSQAQRDAIGAAVAKVPAKQLRAEVSAFEDAMLSRHREAGGQVHEVTADELAAWKQPMAEFNKRELQELGPAAQKLFATVETARLACRK